MSRRRFQRGTVYQNKSKTQWLGQYAEYVLAANGVETRQRKQVILCPVKDGDVVIRKREAQKLFQPYVDRVNQSLSQPMRECKNATFNAFAEIWERDYLSLSKKSTQTAVKSQMKRLRTVFGQKEIRKIDAGDLQRFISGLDSEGYDPKTISNFWGTISLIWNAALAQKYVDAVLPKPKLPKKSKKKPRFFKLDEVAKIIASSGKDVQVFYWLAAETGLRAGELSGLKLTDIDGDKLTVSQSVWNGQEQSPKTDNALRTLALSPQLVSLLWEQIARQKAKGHEYLFSASTGSPWDMNVFRKRKMKALLTSLGMKQAGFHAFRHFNVSLMDALSVPLKVIQERIGHALTGSFTLDVYGGKPEWAGNVLAANKVGAAIAEAFGKVKAETESRNSVSLTAVNENGSGVAVSQAIEN